MPGIPSSSIAGSSSSSQCCSWITFTGGTTSRELRRKLNLRYAGPFFTIVASKDARSAAVLFWPRVKYERRLIDNSCVAVRTEPNLKPLPTTWSRPHQFSLACHLRLLAASLKQQILNSVYEDRPKRPRRSLISLVYLVSCFVSHLH